MKYTKPTYEKEIVHSYDVVLSSPLGGTTLTDVGDGKANVSASLFDIIFSWSK